MSGRYGGYELHDFVAEYYDVVYDRRRPQDIDFFIEYSKNCGGRTLELGCGTGRVLIPTAVSGFEITELDLSPYMLDICRNKLAMQPEVVRKSAELVQGNITDFNINDVFSLVTIPFRPFQHLITGEEQKACLGCIHRHLSPGGLLVFDVFNPDPARLVPNPQFIEEFQEFPETTLPDGLKFRRTSRTAGYHHELQYNDVELIYYVTYPDGQSERLVQSFPMRYYFRYELEHLLENCGFKVIEVFGDFDKSAYSADSPEMIFVSQKTVRSD